MKKHLIVALFLLTGGLTLPGQAQSFHDRGVRAGIFFHSYRPCGTPVYAKRVFCDGRIKLVFVSGHELRRYLSKQRQFAGRRAYRHRVVRERQGRIRYPHHHRSRPSRRRCR